MTRKVAKPRVAAKSAQVLPGNQIGPKGNQISPVMQKVRISLDGGKAAEQLRLLTDQPISNCRKYLCGPRVENHAMLAALFRTHLIAAAIVGLTEGATDPDVRALRKHAKQIMLSQRHRRDLEALEHEGDA